MRPCGSDIHDQAGTGNRSWRCQNCQKDSRIYRFPASYTSRKQRQYFHRENITACSDNIKDLGDYLELEILTDSEENRTVALQKIEDTLKQLGYSMQETTRTSYLSMLMKK